MKLSFKESSPYKLFRKAGKTLRKNIKKYRLIRRRDKAIPVFIFQMGKVASSSIHHTLKKQYPGAVAHAHHIGKDNWESEVFYNWYKEGRKIKIISPVRDPISRNISAFFQHFEDLTGNNLNDQQADKETLLQLFLDKYPHDYPLDWFDNNIRDYFGIDIYSKPFPTDGFTQYNLNNVHLLVFRIDIDDTIKENIIRDYLDFPEFKLINRNIGAEKLYNVTYKNFINDLSLPRGYLAKMSSSRFFSYFYSKQEISDIVSKWS